MMPVLLPVALSIVLALVLLRPRAAMQWLVAEAAFDALAFLVWRQSPAMDPYDAAIGFAVVKLAAFFLTVASVREEEVRWSADRAAIAAALVYALLIPAMTRTPIDGDEPYYLLITESIIHDHDLDLRNQYAHPEQSKSGRTLVAQLGDPVGPRGELYSRHEPFLPLLLIPGYLAGGLYGALATIALFGALVVRSTIFLLDDERLSRRTQRVTFPLLAFGPPIVFYATRIWPEVPAAFFFVEALRGVRDRRAQRWLPACVLMSLLKLRFALVAAPLVLLALLRDRRSVWRRGGGRSRAALMLVTLAAVVAVPMGVAWFVHGNPMNVHELWELKPESPMRYGVGLFGLLLDGAAGMLVQAPLLLLGVFALRRWRSMPDSFRLGVLAALPYVVYLVPRSEWHGGWAPPLRYLVIFVPALVVGVAVLVERWHAAALLPVAGLWTAVLVAHGAARPWELFHIANGENWIGEALSRSMHADVSRLFPSFIRLNTAAIVASVVLLLLFVIRPRMNAALVAAAFVAALSLGAREAQRPGRIVELEDAHVDHQGGALYPELYTVARFLYRGGWIVNGGESLSFLARGGAATLEYQSEAGATIELAGHAIELPATGRGYGSVSVVIEQPGRVTLRCLSGSVNLDRLASRD